MARRPPTATEAGKKYGAKLEKEARAKERAARGIVVKEREKKPAGQEEREYQAELEKRGQMTILDRVRAVELHEVTHGKGSAEQLRKEALGEVCAGAEVAGGTGEGEASGVSEACDEPQECAGEAAQSDRCDAARTSVCCVASRGQRQAAANDGLQLSDARERA